MPSVSATDFTKPESFELSLVAEEHIEIPSPIRLEGADAAARFLHQTFRPSHREHFGVLFFDRHHRLTGFNVAHVGTRRHTFLEPYAVFAPALLANAHAVIVFHNHPSGDPAPSREDRQATRQLAACGQFLGVPLLDHLVLGEPPSYVSLMGQGSRKTP